ncbi:hypothetical protein ASG76_03195 [Nocardioides sp. Soil774]|uniref:hypothetical protein n=1 Tax=Nocardioides sp. Soil774 TaxID=1736408 RepID=UPI0006F90C98|nr:hypothetical protein [Nocardioides sp. Soil774]KRE96068.1 hypothetical protein ASG76_03195 [Nocardioides sp. Soil774]
MTGLLTDLMRERADHLDAPYLDLTAITRTGERRVRRRRTALVGGAATAAALTVLVLPALGGEGPAPARDLAADGTTAVPSPLAWISGSTLHRVGRPDTDLGVDVRAWVWVGDDIAFTDAERRVRLWSGDALDVVGRSAAVPQDKQELFSDGTLVAWLGADGAWQALDTTTGELTSDGAGPYRSDPTRSQVTAIDGSVVYGLDARGVVAWDTTAGRVDVVDRDAARVVIDAEGGVLLRATGDGDARVEGGGRNLAVTVDSFANLSADGAHVVAESDDVGVLLDTTTGERLTLDTGFGWSLPFQWVDDDTVAVLAFTGARTDAVDHPFLVACTVADGACTDAQPLPTAFQLPVGIHFDR